MCVFLSQICSLSGEVMVFDIGLNRIPIGIPNAAGGCDVHVCNFIEVFIIESEVIPIQSPLNLAALIGTTGSVACISWSRVAMDKPTDAAQLLCAFEQFALIDCFDIC